ncbi:MAG: type II secretion system F family protein [Candidatus Sumerlaeota bacterium]
MAAEEKKQSESDELRDNLRKRMGSEKNDVKTPEGDKRQNMQTLRPEDKPKVRKKTSLNDIANMNIALTGPGLNQMTAFCRQLATLVEVGIPLVQSLNILSERIQHPKLKKVVSDVSRRVEEGSSFSDALRAHPKVFSSLVVNVVSIGESAGILEGSLQYLADTMERKADLRRKVMGAAAYPAVALTVCGAVLIFVLTFCIPVFADFYRDNDKYDRLPGITKFLINAGDFVEQWWWLIILLVVAAIASFRILIKKSPQVRYGWDWFCLHFWPVNLVSVKANVARTCRTLSNLLHAGIPLLEALRITSESSENLVVAKALSDTHDTIESGGRIEDPLREADVFPPIVVDMISIGDEAGRLDLMFEKVADSYDSDLDQTVRTLNALLEPALIVVMGGIVLVVMLAVLLPLWQVGDAIFE